MYQDATNFGTVTRLDDDLVKVSIPYLGYDSYKALPNVVSYQGRDYNKGTWNSYRGHVYFWATTLTADDCLIFAE